MAGQSLGAYAPVSSSHHHAEASPGTPRHALHLVHPARTRTRCNHGTFMLGGQLAAVYSARGAGKFYGVAFELGAGTLSVDARMTAGQARSMARALLAGAAAVDSAQRVAQEGGAA